MATITQVQRAEAAKQRPGGCLVTVMGGEGNGGQVDGDEQRTEAASHRDQHP